MGWYCENENANPDCDGTDCCKRPCARHNDCAAELACIGGRCVEGCRDDNLGDISLAANAYRIPFDGNRADLANARLHICKRPNLLDCQADPDLSCDADADWFVLTCLDNMTLNVDLCSYMPTATCNSI